jgi:hypothetical protein
MLWERVERVVGLPVRLSLSTSCGSYGTPAYGLGKPLSGLPFTEDQAPFLQADFGAGAGVM